jgi:hypothetical protein
MTLVTTTAAIDDPHLLGSAFAGASWATWRAVLRAAEGLPLCARVGVFHVFHHWNS